MSNDILLQEARDALHKLILGKAVSVIQKDGRKVDYTPANRADLEDYIKLLEAETSGQRFRRGPARVIF
ncbi:phage head-tail joining protein [Endozoicomonas lisbonensis]|uniref:phage head-tail joining protein n=1 Tax=Endozoicomonas lisbonensis TaxID=3120522 RepID=UPI0033949D63